MRLYGDLHPNRARFLPNAPVPLQLDQHRDTTSNRMQEAGIPLLFLHGKRLRNRHRFLSNGCKRPPCPKDCRRHTPRCANRGKRKSPRRRPLFRSLSGDRPPCCRSCRNARRWQAGKHPCLADPRFRFCPLAIVPR